ncbi:MAG TPA: cytochrome c peroxidase [Anaerolineae bacterium]|nr:cytochrome c peroxidase [Anaerolineae bacterium]
MFWYNPRPQSVRWLSLLLFGSMFGLAVLYMQETVVSPVVVTAEELAVESALPSLGAPDLPDMVYNYANLNLPPYFERRRIRDADNEPNNNRVTNEGATLGRVLFYDVRLSGNDTVACASCHIQEFSFADPARFSVGFEGGLTGRNSPNLVNARYYENGRFFWDERSATLEHQVLQPIQDGVEMGLDLETLVAKLEATDYYPQLFAHAFGDETISSERISLALAQFVRSMVSYQSRYDEGLATNFANFTPSERRGMEIFEGNGRCDNCHQTEIQIADRPRNIGLDGVTTDPGVGGVTGEAEDEGRFKVPSLRNVELTAPYMHDGRLMSLEEVVGFYNAGVQPHPNLDPILQRQDGSPRRLNLSAQEQADLVAFLKTFTDESFVTDPKFSNPFVVDYRLYLPGVYR